jgi:hypothetical protein
MSRLYRLAAMTWLALNLPVYAAGVESGPARGTVAPALKVYDATGPHADKEIDYVADRKDKPTVYVFVVAEKWDRPAAQFLRKLDAEVQNHADGYVVAVWLTDDLDATKKYLPLAHQSLQFKATALTCYPVAKKTPEGWGINLEAGVTAVVAKRGKVIGSLGFRSATGTDVKAVMELMGKAADGK